MNLNTIDIPFDEDLLPARMLQFGKYTCMYEHGRIRYISFSNVELIRMIYFAVRDKNWNTLSYTIGDESIETHKNGFKISYTALHRLDSISYRSDILIVASGERLTFFARGQSLSNFERNRIGICLLHPIKEYRGREVVVERPDGSTYQSSFPDLVKPNQPFTEIRKMHCSVSEGLSVDMNFEGETFETEDQRNWSDGSYKTYSTPLAIPFPVSISEGAVLEQKIGLTIFGEGIQGDAALATTEQKIPFPKIGYGVNYRDELAESEIQLLLQIPFDHYRVELYLSNQDWEKILELRFREATQLKTKLELVLFFSDDFAKQLQRFLSLIKDQSVLVRSVLIIKVFQNVTSEDIFASAFPEIKKHFAHIEVGYGSDGFFADLNRNRPSNTYFDFISFPLTPQVHAFDTRSLIENLESQRDLIRAANTFAQGKKIFVSPITFRIRSSSMGEGARPADYDTRQHRSFGALWTLSCIRNLCDADSLTFYEVKGYRGILSGETHSSHLSATFQYLKTIRKFAPEWIIVNDAESLLPRNLLLEDANGNRLEFNLESTRIFKSSF